MPQETEKKNKKAPPLRKGDAKAQFIQCVDFIREELSQGRSYTQIWEELRATSSVTMSRSAFYALLRSSGLAAKYNIQTIACGAQTPLLAAL